MRVSASPDDPGYLVFAKIAPPARRHIRVFLDDREQRRVITADDETGLVLRLVLDADGRAQIDPVEGNKVWVETVHGSVRIEMPS